MATDTTYVRCAKTHSDMPFTASEKCVNCSGNHSANYNQCPRFIAEKEIQKIRVTEKVSFPEARRRHQSRNPVDLSRSFSTVARLTRTSAGVQTDTPSMCKPSLCDSGCQVVEEDIKLAMLAAESSVGTTVDQSVSVDIIIDSSSDAIQRSSESKSNKSDDLGDINGRPTRVSETRPNPSGSRSRPAAPGKESNLGRTVAPITSEGDSSLEDIADDAAKPEFRLAQGRRRKKKTKTP